MDRFNNDILRKCVLRHLPSISRENDLRIEPISTGKFNTSYFVRADTIDLVLRIAPARDAVFLFYERSMMHQEPGIHSLLLERTLVPVPRILAFDTSSEVIERDYLIMERLRGKPLSDVTGVDLDQVLRDVGLCLAQVHGITAPHFGYLGEHRPMAPQDTWTEAFLVMWNAMIDDISATGHYSTEEARILRRLAEDHRAIFGECQTASLLHMDVWSQNILVDGSGHLSGLIDWDRALWGDPEIEFAVLDYCGISEPAFWEGYGRRRSESREARLRNVFYLLYEIQKYIVIRHGRQKDPGLARSYKRQTFDLIRRAFT